jgi:hypothetical protein
MKTLLALLMVVHAFFAAHCHHAAANANVPRTTQSAETGER